MSLDSFLHPGFWNSVCLFLLPLVISETIILVSHIFSCGENVRLLAGTYLFVAA